jgi:hypothetical protein
MMTKPRVLFTKCRVSDPSNLVPPPISLRPRPHAHDLLRKALMVYVAMTWYGDDKMKRQDGKKGRSQEQGRV